MTGKKKGTTGYYPYHRNEGVVFLFQKFAKTTFCLFSTSKACSRNVNVPKCAKNTAVYPNTSLLG